MDVGASVGIVRDHLMEKLIRDGLTFLHVDGTISLTGWGDQRHRLFLISASSGVPLIFGYFVYLTWEYTYSCLFLTACMAVVWWLFKLQKAERMGRAIKVNSRSRLHA